MRTARSIPIDDALPGVARQGAIARSVFDAWDSRAAVLDAHGRISLINAAWERFGRDNHRFVDVGSDYLAVLDEAAKTDPVVAGIAVGLRAVLTGTLPRFRDEHASHSSEQRRWYEVSASPIPVDGEMGLLLVQQDITARKRQDDDRRARMLLVDEVDAAVIATDLQGVVTSWSQGAERLLGWPAHQAIGQTVYELIGGSGATGEAQRFFGRGADHDTWEGNFTASRRDGSTIAVYARNFVVRDGDGKPTGMVGIAVDRTERLAMNRQLAAITDSIGDGLCTLDRAGLVTYVNPPGRRMLRADLTGALGGSFLHWVHAPPDAAAWTPAAASGSQTHPVTCQLVRLDGTEVAIEYVATPLYTDPTAPPTGWVVVFRDISARHALEDARARQVEEVMWLGRIRTALNDDGFVIYAQPIVDLATGRTVQHELLLRMRDTDGMQQLISPARFLPTAEALGIAPAIDRWVIARGLEFAARGHPVHINLSATSLGDSALPHLIEQLLAETGARPADVVFEITETALLDNDVNARYFAERVHELGCQLALDDFGTGYGSFTYIKQFPIDYLKIDIEFVRDAVTNPASRHVLDAVVSLAKAFRLRTVAEGVEDEETLELLRRLGVDLAQGYLLGRPAHTTIVFGSPSERVA